ncbi:MAG: threonine--tRNA ligase [Rickettsiales bacterium]
MSTVSQIKITFPDGNVRNYAAGITGAEIAAGISKSLEKKALVIEVDGEQIDLYIPIHKDCAVKIITADSPEGLEVIRHDAAHILAEAVKNLFPETQVTIGPSIENGFYYDFARKEAFSPEDFPKIEEEMKRIVARAEKIHRKVVTRAEAIQHFEKLGEHYKVEIIRDLPENGEISLYGQGEFADLCRGPHSPVTSHVKAFKLMKIAGAYWRGDSKNEMLQRIYGTAWATQEQLDAYLTQLEEAERRDHRKIGKEMDLFHLQEEAVGSVFWHDKGWRIYRVVEDYIRRRLSKSGYFEVKTPLLVDRSLWEASGHWEKFRENMFTSEADEKVMALKPMNCPCHIQIYNQGIKSYRDLPLRMAEFGTCHRNESSGSLHGIMRVRSFTQDDAHIFCTEDMINSETVAFCELLRDVYKDFGFNEFRVKFSDRPAVRAGTDAAWDKAEALLKEAITATGIEYTDNLGEGAFYGPKLEFVLRDSIGRDWQCGTLQVDFILPERLQAYYIGEDGAKHHPVMIHRAILGTLERFIGILIEQHAGHFPLWLAPTQVMITTITSDIDNYAVEVNELLKANGIRSEVDLENEKIGYKVRKHSLAKTPIIVTVGKSEAAKREVSIRRLGSEQQEILDINEFLHKLKVEALPPK